MLTALYYPHTTIRNPALLKNALLLWDQVECITPSFGLRPHRFEHPDLNEASDIVVRQHIPTTDERESVHVAVSDLVRRGIPDWFRPDATSHPDVHRPYWIYPKKLAHETWQLLEDEQLAQWNGERGDYGVSGPLGLLVMSLLADACAGTQKRKITDRADAYGWLAKFATASLGGEYIAGLDTSQASPEYDRLVTMSIRIIDTDGIPLDRILSLRKREATESGSDYRTFRLNYLRRLDAYVARLASVRTMGDKTEIERQFQEEMRSDLANLKKELRLTSRKTLLSKEVAVSALAVAGALVEPISGITTLATTFKTVGVGALLKTNVEYRAARRKALRESGMSWLYLADRKGRLTHEL